MTYKHWTLDDIPWSRFEPDKVRADQVRIIKAAAMVEYNAADYVTYLEHVFQEDDLFIEAARRWGIEEVQHGEALSRWASTVDPDFDFDSRFAAYREGFRLDLDTEKSVRGSRPGELVARCMVEVGTSSYYTAIGDGTDEPVLRAICRKIASDELRHYKLFYDHLKRYLSMEGLNRFQRIRVALGRIAETEDDELSYAYYAANNRGEAYDRERCNKEYRDLAYRYYKEPHVDRGMAMIFKACGLKPHSTLFNMTSRGVRWYLQRRQKHAPDMAA